MKNWLAYLLIILVLGSMAACQTEKDELSTSKNQGNARLEEREQMIKHPTHIAGYDPEGLEQIVVIGVEGFKEEVRFKQFSNSWLVMWVDPRLEVEESDELVQFSGQQEELLFSVQRLPASEIENKHQRLDEQLAASGYQRIDQFPLDDREGSGCIYYSYEEQVSIDHYVLNIDTEHAFLVQFSLPEQKMEAYTHRFEYMLESISKRDV